MRAAKGLTVLVATVAALLFAAPSAGAAIDDAFDGALSCAPAGADGHRECSGIVRSFDGAPIDVNLGIPPDPGGGSDGPYPLAMEFHGWGGQKFGVDQDWIDRGYAYFSMTDRGWGDSCGRDDPKVLTDPACADVGYNHLMDTRYEVRDAQLMAGLLVDDGIADPAAIGAFGGSYGGGMSMALAALKNRTMMPDGELVPWESPEGTPISLAAAAPNIPWTDLAYSLLPTGRTLDYVADAPYGPGKIGVMKQSFVSGLWGLGQLGSTYAPPGKSPDLNGWFTLINAGEPYDSNPLAAEIVEEVTSYHSSYYIDDSVPPAPLLISNGWTDDIFPVDEALRFYNRTKANHPGARVSLLFADEGHQRAQNKDADIELLADRRDAFFDFHLKGEGPDPGVGVEALTQTCPEGEPSGGPFTAPSWKQLSPGEVRFEEGTAKLIAPAGGNPASGQAYDPITGPGACATADAADAPGIASYRLDPAPAGGYTLMGSPTIVADILNLGPSSQLAARLVDVDPETGEQTLVARGLYRPADGAEAERQVFQLHPNGYRFAPGHVAKLELMPSDAPYSRPSNGQTPITVAGLDLRLPVLESPGSSAAVTEPAPKVVPKGYALAPDYADEPVDSDGDGIEDGADGCPARPGPAGSDGCPEPNPPDADGDGIPDATDACPDEAGPAEGNGCPTGEERPGPCEVELTGTSGRDRLVGTAASELFKARGGRDRIKARGGGDCVRAGRGTDRVKAAAGGDEIRGAKGADRIKGGKGRDQVKGGRGADRIKGGKGGDRVRAGRGADRINGGRGVDEIRAGSGPDRVRSHDGRREIVRCGKGRDRVKADRRDRLVGCEKVR